MACVHYKFSFQSNYKSIPLSGSHITVGDLKAKIMRKERLKASHCDLTVSNDQNEEYTDETARLEKFSCVIVRRIPSRAPVRNRKAAAAPPSPPPFTEIPDLLNAKASEEDKIQAVIHQSTCYYQMKDGSQKSLGPPPPHYVCHRCGHPGHYIRECPMRLVKDQGEAAPKKARKCHGIPQSFLVKAEAGAKGAMLTSSGEYVMSAVDEEGYRIGKKEHPPFVPRTPPKTEVASAVPEELTCAICESLMVDAAIVPCCGHSFCDDCIRNALLESEEHTCFACQQSVSPDSVIRNLALRLAIRNYENNMGYTTWKSTGSDVEKHSRKSRSHRFSPLHSRHRSRSRSPIRGSSHEETSHKSHRRRGCP